MVTKAWVVKGGYRRCSCDIFRVEVNLVFVLGEDRWRGGRLRANESSKTVSENKGISVLLLPLMGSPFCGT